ncbi:hypothetical protein MGH68_04635 [Erysipelothrix sp. D19-032]
MKQKIAKLLMIVGIGLFSYNIVTYSTNFMANLLPLSKFAIGLVAISVPWHLKNHGLNDSMTVSIFSIISSYLQHFMQGNDSGFIPRLNIMIQSFIFQVARY